MMLRRSDRASPKAGFEATISRFSSLDGRRPTGAKGIDEIQRCALDKIRKRPIMMDDDELVGRSGQNATGGRRAEFFYFFRSQLIEKARFGKISASKRQLFYWHLRAFMPILLAFACAAARPQVASMTARRKPSTPRAPANIDREADARAPRTSQ
jgi:hypothetical protein